MRCEKCGLDLIISEKSPLSFEGDTSEKTATKAYYDFTYTCRNKECPDHGKKVEVKRVYLD